MGFKNYLQKYQEGNITLYQADCMEMLPQIPDKFYELCIVDPPYGIGESRADFASRATSSPKWKRARPKIYEKKDWDTVKVTEQYFTEVKRVALNQIIWGANFYVEYLKSSPGWIFWNKLNGASDYSDGELAWSSFNKGLRQFSFLWNGFQRGEITYRIHPTQKPIKLYEWLLKNYAKQGDKILDTHLGSGSIAIACYNLDFSLVGFEIDKDYYEAACKRLEEHKKQLRIFA